MKNVRRLLYVSLLMTLTTLGCGKGLVIANGVVASNEQASLGDGSGIGSEIPSTPSLPDPTDDPSDDPLTETPPTTTPANPGTGGSGGGTGHKVTPLWESAVADGKEWTTHVMNKLDTIGVELIMTNPADANLFCPNYANLSNYDRKQYWTYMISSMARFESNFKTQTQYTESFSDSNGNRVVSRGLLQLSIESGNAYGCAFRTAKDLHDPYQNLNCGIRILNRWVSRDKRIAGKVSSQWRGGARYWSVLRAGDKESYKSILKWSQALPICKP